jgi:DNA repair exonuclease SbcCD nuclease subunit
VWGKSKVLAIFLADIHLSINPPLWRSAERDWLEAQRRPLKEVRALQDKHKCPVICAGDIFDRNKKIADGWNAPAELINYAIDYLPDMYAIPGQHDLPNHQYDEIQRSAYWTLVKAGKIKNIPVGLLTVGEHLVLSAFPLDYEIIPGPLNGYKNKDDIYIAVVHQYRCIVGKDYPTAPGEAFLHQNESNLMGYDVIVYGDNHRGFITDVNRDSTVFNCGTLMRRKSDEIDYKPQVGLLLESGKVVSYYLDTSEDKHLDAVDMALKEEEEEKEDLDMSDFFDGLEKLGKTALDFKEAMKEHMHRTGRMSCEAKQIIFNAMEK